MLLLLSVTLHLLLLLLLFRIQSLKTYVSTLRCIWDLDKDLHGLGSRPKVLNKSDVILLCFDEAVAVKLILNKGSIMKCRVIWLVVSWKQIEII
jgi:hypothetical protein